MKNCMIETSARHVHVTRQVLEALFGEGYALTHMKDLSQPGQFACEEQVLITGPNGSLKARLIGPERSKTQVELSATDARALGIDAQVRESGDIAGTPGCKLTGPAGELELTHGCIISCRHVHMSPADAAKYGVQDHDLVRVKSCDGYVFEDVLVRVKDSFTLAVHIDVDDAKAAGIGRGECPQGEIIA